MDVWNVWNMWDSDERQQMSDALDYTIHALTEIAYSNALDKTKVLLMRRTTRDVQNRDIAGGSPTDSRQWIVNECAKALRRKDNAHTKVMEVQRILSVDVEKVEGKTRITIHRG